MGIDLTSEQLAVFETYAAMLLDWNTRMNLTAITQPEEVAVKHFLDSLSVSAYCDIPAGARVVDVGTGAGFPGVPMKIVRPDIGLTLLDSTNKRLKFLAALCGELAMKAELVHMRAEDAGRALPYRGRFDVAVARAVARLQTLAAWCLPLVRAGSTFVAMKGPDCAEEMREAETAIAAHGGRVRGIRAVALPGDIHHSLIIVDKTR